MEIHRNMWKYMEDSWKIHGHMRKIMETEETMGIAQTLRTIRPAEFCTSIFHYFPSPHHPRLRHVESLRRRPRCQGSGNPVLRDGWKACRMER